MRILFARRTLLTSGLGALSLGTLEAFLGSGCTRAPAGRRERLHSTPVPTGTTRSSSITSTQQASDREEPAKPLPTPSAEKPRGAIVLIPMGTSWSEADLTFVIAALRLYFPNAVTVLEPRALPDDAYFAPRHRYRAERLLSFLEGIASENAQVKVGLTTVDISTTKDDVPDWGILGLATLSGETCVISRYRAQRGSRSKQHTRERLAKVVLHEVGHTAGLPHCPSKGCIMEDAGGKVATTDSEEDFCALCRTKVGDALLPKPKAVPWTVRG